MECKPCRGVAAVSQTILMEVSFSRPRILFRPQAVILFTSKYDGLCCCCSGHTLLKWIKTLLTIHTSYLMTVSGTFVKWNLTALVSSTTMLKMGRNMNLAVFFKRMYKFGESL